MEYYVYFVGASESGKWIRAESMSAAKKAFAEEHGVRLSAYIKASKRGPQQK